MTHGIDLPIIRWPRCAGWLLTVALLARPLTSPAGAADDDGFLPIFNGASLEGWDANPKFWRVDDGAITGQTATDNPTAHNTFCILRAGGPVGDFVLKADFKIDGGNSGIQYRSKESPDWVVGGYQADFDAAGVWTGSLYEERGRGVLAKRGAKVVIGADGKKEQSTIADEKEVLEIIKKGDWNTYEVSAIGNHLTQKVNGKTTIELIDDQADKRAMSGIIALQVHAGPPMKVQFKNILLKRLTPSSGSK
jgi:hypothetical protein